MPRREINNNFLHCRVCLTRTRNVRSMFESKRSDNMRPNEMLMSLTGVIVDKELDINLPRVICKTCELSLNKAYDFRLTALRSNEIITKYRNENITENAIIALDNGKKYNLPKELTLKVIKNKTTTDNNSDEFVNLSPKDDKDCLKNEKLDNSVDLIISEEFSDEDFEISENNKTIDSISNHAISPLNLKNIEADEDPLIFGDNEKNENDKPINKIKKTILKSKTKTKNQNKTSNTNVLKKNSTFNDIRRFVCEICGNSFVNRTSLSIHLKRHNNEKPFECELCGDGFLDSEKLRRHMSTHGALKPYKCRMCERRFLNPSLRKYHEFFHLGIKPHVCRICDKGFIYISSLKKHLLIHTNEKLYKCICCNLCFRLPQHLKQHNATFKHKYNFENAKEI